MTKIAKPSVPTTTKEGKYSGDWNMNDDVPMNSENHTMNGTRVSRTITAKPSGSWSKEEKP